MPMSFLLLIQLGSLEFFIINIFSVVHRSQNLNPGLIFLAVWMMLHSISGNGPRLCSQIYCDSVVLFFLAEDLKECVC